MRSRGPITRLQQTSTPRIEEGQHRTSRLSAISSSPEEEKVKEKGVKEVTDAQAGMPLQKLRRNMRSKIR